MRVKNNKMYQKLFVSYTCIILIVVVILESYFYITIKNREVTEVRDGLSRMTTQVMHYFTLLEENTELMMQLMYQSESQVKDVMSYLEHDTRGYLEAKLDGYLGEQESQNEDMLSYMNKVFKIHSALSYVTFISEDQQKMITYGQDGNVFTKGKKAKEGLLYDNKVCVMAGQVAIVKVLYKPQTYEKKGYMIATYDTQGLKQYEKYDLLVWGTEGQWVYGRGALFEELGPLGNIEVISQKDLEDQMGRYISLTHHDMGLSVMGSLRKKAVTIPPVVYITLVLLGLTVWGIGEYLVYQRLSRLSYRTNAILEGMSKVKEGNFDVKIQVQQEADELDLLANHFNTMCYDLQRYVTQNYVLEIAQQQAQIKALQSQINPHFLYNTLEAIRMKAICNGDREVAKMVYGLAVLFRGQVKESDQITLAKELHYCKKYIEIFTYRYENQFQFEFDYEEEDLPCLVIKLMIQPIIENYFVHGIRLEDSDNMLYVSVEREGELLSILVKDNGRGVTSLQCQEIQEKLEGKREGGDSIGMMNVHRRMQMVYGEDYGLVFAQNEPTGVCVTMTIPVTRGDEYVSSNVSG